MAAGAAEGRQYAFVSSTETEKRKHKIVRRHLNQEIKRSKTSPRSKLASFDYQHRPCHPSAQALNGTTQSQPSLPPSGSPTLSSGEEKRAKIPREPPGAASFDPFLSYPQILPAETTSELLRHSIVTCFEGIRPSPPRLTDRSEASAWLSAAVQSPAFFSAILFGASYHLNESFGTHVPPHRLQKTLSAKAAVIEYLSADISVAPIRIKDSTLATIWILSGHNALFEPTIDIDCDLTQPPGTTNGFRLPFNRILTALQRLDLLSESPFLAHHVDALVKVVSARGGLQSLKLAALPQLVSAADVVLSTLTNSPPRLPLPPASPIIIGYCNLQLIINHANAHPDELEESGNSTPLLQALDDLIGNVRRYTYFLELYITSRVVQPDLSALADWRNRIQHGILSLLPASDLPPSKNSTDSSAIVILARLAHSALLMYSHLVIFPISESVSPRLLPTYLDSFISAFQSLKMSKLFSSERRESSSSSSPDSPDSHIAILLWALTLASITATAIPPEHLSRHPSCYNLLHSSLRQLVSFLQIPTPEEFTRCLSKVVWSSHTLDGAAMRVWDVIQGGTY